MRVSASALTPRPPARPRAIAVWKVKNSMGADWGEDGYIRLQKGLTGQNSTGICDIAARASFPTL